MKSTAFSKAGNLKATDKMALETVKQSLDTAD